MTATPHLSVVLPCDIDPEDTTTREARSKKHRTGVTLHVHVNPDTVVSAERRKNGRIVVHIADHDLNAAEMSLHLDDSGVARLIHALQSVYDQDGTDR